jgi:E3 ubiquitin-protein ligase BIG BROTHER-like protein
MNSGGFNNLFFDGPFGFLSNRNIQRINPNFNPGDYEDYYEGNNINSLITGPRNNNYINNFNDESKIEQDIIDQLYPDPDKMTYEQLLELEENVGSVSKGLTKNQIKKIPKIMYNKNRFGKDDNKCVVCQYEFKNGEEVTKLSCGHLFHSDCVDTWLSKNKVCPMCHKEIIIK